MRAWEFLPEAEWDPSGWGGTPYGTDIDYFGIRVRMRPSTFLKLAAPLDRTQMNPAVKKHMAGGGKIAYPMLEVKIPEGWEEDDLHDYATVASHEGRNRVTNWMETHGDEPIQVNIIGRGGMRRRHFTPEIIERLSQGMHGERGRMFVRGPLFDVNTVLEEGKEENSHHNSQDLEDVAQWMRTTPDKLNIVVKQEPIEKFIKQIREMYGTYDEFPEDEERTNRILKLLKRGAKPLPMYVEDGDPSLFVMEGRHRMVAFWLAGMKTIPVAYVSVKQQGVTEDTVDEMALKSYTPLGNFDKPGPFRGPDKKLIPHPKNIEKAT